MNPDIIQQARNNTPLIHHLTNQVVMNFNANGLLAFGGSPVMAKEIREAADMAKVSDALVLNIGTILESEADAMITAGKAANEKGIPVVLDPVGVAATSFRKDMVEKILQEVRPTVIKGNAGEIASLVDANIQSRGVDSVGEGNVDEIAEQAGRKYDTAIVITGKTDVIHADQKLIYNQTGHPLLSNITGSGCLLGSIAAACLTTSYTVSEQLSSALSFYGLAAEHAAKLPHVHGPGTFLPSFIDALSFTPKQLNGGLEDDF
ncbi:hydroxyethylthiazole kinase [Oceanobacillus oncorhynchi]|uniref:hydroxyethylthiazole kinase n=1 Tax=Oceanobacillus oncorhynchi TaxID=545501 RepID=UPI002116B470|nr:hydroxyethylthiazole kinase [Oceanobacillus oncorhynchi]MDM8100296.1 hydroxyethylthiazole kinase [Oceanobacillus oncorhynchi]UUI40890.1 hydroxyethylthiazole kinase [Oceanobacillus oncorhynchi]